MSHCSCIKSCLTRWSLHCFKWTDSGIPSQLTCFPQLSNPSQVVNLLRGKPIVSLCIYFTASLSNGVYPAPRDPIFRVPGTGDHLRELDEAVHIEYKQCMWSLWRFSYLPTGSGVWIDRTSSYIKKLVAQIYAKPDSHFIPFWDLKVMRSKCVFYTITW